MIDSTDLPNFSDDAIRRFLLGRLSTAEQSEFEHQLFVDGKLETRVRLAELALADDYAGARLSRAQEDRFRERFSVSTDRKQLVAVSAALHDRFGLKTVNSSRRLRALPHINQPVWRYAFAALLLLVVFATFWRGIKEPQLVENIIPKPAAPKPKASPVQTPVETNHPGAASSPTHDEQAPTLPPHPAAGLTVVLDAKSSPDNWPVVRATNGSAVIKFQLLPPNSWAGSYRADIFTIEGQHVFSADSLQSMDGSKLELNVPARVLKTGGYQIRLTRVGSFESGGRYYFRVQ